MSSPVEEALPTAGGIADDVALDSGGARLTLYTILLVATLIASVLINAYQGRRLSALRAPIDELKQTIRGLNALADAEASETKSLIVSAPVERPLAWGWAVQSAAARAVVLELREGDAWSEQRRAELSEGRRWVGFRLAELRVGVWQARLDVRPLNDSPNTQAPPATEPLELPGALDEALAGDRVVIATLDEPSFGENEELLRCGSQADDPVLRLRIVDE